MITGHAYGRRATLEIARQAANSTATVLLLVGGLVIAALGVTAVPELRRRHPTSTVVMVAAPAIALGAVMVLFSLDAVLPVTY
mgnify:CR=1 FL=1